MGWLESRSNTSVPTVLCLGVAMYFVFRMNGSLTEKTGRFRSNETLFKFELKECRISLLKQSRGEKQNQSLKDLRALLGTFKILSI